MALTQVPIELSSTPGIVDNSNATAITIDSSENVGIGTSSPSTSLDVVRAGVQPLRIQSTSGTEVAINMVNTGGNVQLEAHSGNFNIDADAVGIGESNPQELLHLTATTPVFRMQGGSRTYQQFVSGTNFVIRDVNAGLNRVTLDSSGNLLVGKTATNTLATVGHDFGVSGYVMHTRNSSNVLYLNRNTTDGAIQEFYKDGSTVGSISVEGGDLAIGNDDAGIQFVNGTEHFRPFNITTNAATDALMDIGSSSKRFKDLYRSGSTYSASDRNMKQDIRDLTDAERNVAVAAKGLLKAFRFIDAVEVEGDSANIHFGIIAQDLAAAFTAEGLDANDYQVYKSATTTDEDGNEQTRLNVCYENLLAFIISAI